MRSNQPRTSISFRLSPEANSVLVELARRENSTPGLAARGILERTLLSGESTLQESIEVAAVLAEFHATLEAVIENQVRLHRFLRRGLELVLLNVARDATESEVRQWVDRISGGSE